MKKHIPNTVTLLNLFCGCCALVAVFQDQFMTGFWFFFIGGWADFLDGLIARLLHVRSDIGKQLDSLADMVTFGVLPGAILYVLLARSIGSTPESQGLVWFALPGFMVTVFSALRLSKFNVDTRQEEHFLGLATPSCTAFVAGLMLIYHFDSFGLREWVSNPWFLYGSTLVLSWLLISEIPMFSFKLKGFQWKGNEIKFIFAAVVILLLIIVREVAFSLGILIYLLINISVYLLTRTQRL